MITRRLQLSPDGPGKVQSCVGRFLTIRLLFSSIDHCVATPSGVTLAPGIRGMLVGSKGIAQWWLTSFEKTLFSAVAFSGSSADLLFPRSNMKVMSDSLSSSEIGLSGYEAPSVMIVLIAGQCWWYFSNGSSVDQCLNSEPYVRIVFCVS